MGMITVHEDNFFLFLFTILVSIIILVVVIIRIRRGVGTPMLVIMCSLESPVLVF